MYVTIKCRIGYSLFKKIKKVDQSRDKDRQENRLIGRAGAVAKCF
jgi:hypothetical protein